MLNLQGDVVGLIDASGEWVAEYTYSAWGEITASSGTMAEINPLRYRGYYYDNETGFYYLQSRYYDPANHRFINADSLASTGQGFVGTNMFAYCRNNPVIRKDASGTDDVCATDFNTDNSVFNDLGAPSGSGSGGGGATSGGAVTGGTGGTGGSETVELFRAVSGEEARSFQETGQLSAKPGQMEGKFFATSSSDAQTWGGRMGSSEMIRIRVPRSSLSHSSVIYFQRLDGIGPAYYFSDLEYLNSVSII